MAHPVFHEYGTPLIEQYAGIAIVEKAVMSFDERVERHSRGPVVIDQRVVEVEQDRTQGAT